MDGLGARAVVDVDDAIVAGGGAQLCGLGLHQAGEDDRQQRRVLEDAERTGLIRVRLTVRAELVAEQAEHHEVVRLQPVEKGAGRIGRRRRSSRRARRREPTSETPRIIAG